MFNPESKPHRASGPPDPRPEGAGPWGTTPATEDDGGESELGGHTRERQPAVADQDPPDVSEPSATQQSSKQQKQIDESLKATFPASDPPSFMGGGGS